MGNTAEITRTVHSNLSPLKPFLLRNYSHMPSNKYEAIKQVLKTPVTKTKTKDTLADYPRKLRGPSNNRYGGHQAQNLRGLKGNTYGPASPGKRFTREQIREYEKSLRHAGAI
jgi:hypothetical protein